LAVTGDVGQQALDGPVARRLEAALTAGELANRPLASGMP
jgi:hypothetical protein